MDVDVIVVGAGPAGSTAAREIRGRGHGVLLLDRASFPRAKPCGGGVSTACAGLLPFDLTSVVEHEITGLVFGDPASGMVTRDLGHVVAYLTERLQFDALLVERAEDAGVEFRDGAEVTGVERQPDGSFEVLVGGGAEIERLRTRVVIGADGANGIVRRELGFSGELEMGVALEGDLACPDGVPDWLEGRVALAPGAAPGGYAWLFPKGKWINIGVGGREGAGPVLRSELWEYTRRFGWDPESLEGVRGHRLPLRRGPLEVAAGGAAVVGDAAGLIDALAGGGIHGAVVSGIAVAAAAHDYLEGTAADLSGYAAELERDFLPKLERLRQVADVVYGWPEASTWALRHSSVAWGLASRLVGGADGAGGGAGEVVLRPVAALGRRRLERMVRPAGSTP